MKAAMDLCDSEPSLTAIWKIEAFTITTENDNQMYGKTFLSNPPYLECSLLCCKDDIHVRIAVDNSIPDSSNKVEYEISVIGVGGTVLQTTERKKAEELHRGYNRVGDLRLSVEFLLGVKENFLSSGSLTVLVQVWSISHPLDSTVAYLLRDGPEAERYWFSSKMEGYSSPTLNKCLDTSSYTGPSLEANFVRETNAPEEIEVHIKANTIKNFIGVACKIFLIGMDGTEIVFAYGEQLFDDDEVKDHEDKDEEDEDEDEWQTLKVVPLIQLQELLPKKHLYLHYDVLTLRFEIALLKKDVEVDYKKVIPFETIKDYFKNSLSFPRKNLHSWDLSCDLENKRLRELVQKNENEVTKSKETIQSRDLEIGRLQESVQSYENEKNKLKEIFTIQQKKTEIFTDHMRYLYNKRQFTDATVSSGNKTFPVHRAVLSARSPVLEAFFHRESEKAMPDAVLPEMDEPVLEKMLQFLYTDNLEEELEWESALKLHTAAGEYKIHGLKEKSSNFLKTNITNTNVCELLEFGDAQHDEDLKTAAQDHIVTNHREIFNLDEWKTFFQKKPLLAAQVYQIMWEKSLVN